MVQHSRSRGRGRSMAGGDAATWGSQVHGSMADQFARTFQGTGPATYGPVGSSGSSGFIGAPTGSQLAHIQQGGGRHRHRRSRHRRSRSARRRSRKQRGGMWGALLEQAAAPLVLLGLQQSFRSKRHHRH